MNDKPTSGELATPRTDAIVAAMKLARSCYSSGGYLGPDQFIGESINLARTLERELTEARADRAALIAALELIATDEKATGSWAQNFAQVALRATLAQAMQS